MNYYASQLNKSMKHSIVEDIRQKREPYRKFADKAQEMLKKEREKWRNEQPKEDIENKELWSEYELEASKEFTDYVTNFFDLQKYDLLFCKEITPNNFMPHPLSSFFNKMMDFSYEILNFEDLADEIFEIEVKKFYETLQG